MTTAEATESKNEVAYKEEPDDEAKADYITSAVQDPVDFEGAKPLDCDLLAAIEWARGKSPQEIMNARETMMCAIERYGEQIKTEGLDQKW